MKPLEARVLQPVVSRFSGVPGRFWGSSPFTDLGHSLGEMLWDLGSLSE